MGTPALQHSNLDSTSSDEVYAVLRQLTLFKEANEDALQFVSQHLERVIANRGDCIILENERNEFVYFVERGAVEIVSYLADDKRIQRLVLIKQGGHFAEFSALTKAVRSGSAYAYEDSVLWRMSGATFMELLQKFPSVSDRLVKLLGELSVRMEQAREVVPFYLPSQLHLPSEMSTLLPVASWKRHSVIPVLHQAGLLTVIMKDQHNPQFIQYMKTAFPQYELAIHLISEHEFDSALAIAQSVSKSSSRSLQSVKDHPPVLELTEALYQSELFKGLSSDVVEKILPYINKVESKAGTKIFTPDKEIDSHLLLVKGKISVLRPLSLDGKLLAPVLTILPGDGFGEVHCLFGSKSPYVVRAAEDSVFYSVPKVILTELMKLPEFLVGLSQNLAHHLQRLGHIRGLHNFKGDEQLPYSEILNLLPMPVIEENKMMPLRVVDGEVLIGLVNPDSSGVIATLGRYLRDQRIKMFAINEEQFTKWSAQLKQAKSVNAAENPQTSTQVTAVGKMATDVIKLAESLLVQGMTSRASDIHFEPSDQKLSVRFRVDGVLQESAQNFPLEIGREVVSRLKLISHMDIAQQHIPQDGQLKTEINGMEIVARASSVPIRAGEKMVLRLIRPQSGVVPLSMLAPDRRVINILQGIAKCRQGLFLVCGPTGSGKTTTLYSLLSSINHVSVNVTTLEDPVEMEIPGLNQIEVDRKRGLDFQMVLRSVLRQDPNIIMVGEIRDAESAKIVFEAAHTGHLVLSTLHTNSSLDVPARLKELGVNTATIADGLLGVLSQRLLRANCRRCLTDRPTTAQEQELFITMLNVEPPATLRQGKGCPACRGSGYHDRLPVFEVWRNTLAMQQVILDHGSPEQLLKISREDKFDTLVEFSLKMVLSGLTSMDEVKRVLSASLF